MKCFQKKGSKLLYKLEKVVNFPNEGRIFCLNCNEHKLFVREADLKKQFTPRIVRAESQTVDYYKELINIKDKLIERINKINQAIKYTNARLSGLDSNSPEGEKLEISLNKYEDDLKYFQDVLEDVKDKIVDFQALQSRVSLERQIDLNQLYNDIGVDPSTLQEEEVEIIPDNQENEEITVTKETENTVEPVK